MPPRKTTKRKYVRRAKPQSIGIQVGATKEAVDAARAAILDILTTEREEETVRVALESFTRVTQVGPATVSYNTITMKE